MKKISVITCVYNEESLVRDVYEEIKRVFANLQENYDYEHLFIDNCSVDRTVPILKEIAKNDKKVKILVFSRNFGPQKNIMTGYRYATGDAVICYEGNLKDPAELIPAFIKNWENGHDVVYGVRTKTQDVFLMQFMRKAFYWVTSALSEDKLPLNAGEFRLLDRKVVNELAKLDDYNPYIRGLVTSIGFKQVGVEYIRKARPRGFSKSTIGSLIDFAINALVSYSIAPIRLCTYIGLVLSFFSIISALIYLILKLFFWPPQIPALAAVIYIILFFSGIQLFFLGIIGEYVGAIHSQVRKKPFVIIREKINFD